MGTPRGSRGRVGRSRTLRGRSQREAQVVRGAHARLPCSRGRARMVSHSLPPAGRLKPLPMLWKKAFLFILSLSLSPSLPFSLAGRGGRLPPYQHNRNAQTHENVETAAPQGNPAQVPGLAPTARPPASLMYSPGSSTVSCRSGCLGGLPCEMGRCILTARVAVRITPGDIYKGR